VQSTGDELPAGQLFDEPERSRDCSTVEPPDDISRIADVEG